MHVTVGTYVCVCMCTTRAHTQRTLIHTHVFAHAHSVHVHYGGECGTSTVIHENDSRIIVAASDMIRNDKVAELLEQRRAMDLKQLNQVNPICCVSHIYNQSVYSFSGHYVPLGRTMLRGAMFHLYAVCVCVWVGGWVCGCVCGCCVFVAVWCVCVWVCVCALYGCFVC